MAAGCQLERFGFGAGGSMQNYPYRQLMGRPIRVGFVGIGGRGNWRNAEPWGIVTVDIVVSRTERKF